MDAKDWYVGKEEELKGSLHNLEIINIEMPHRSILRLNDSPSYDLKTYPWIKIHLEYVRYEIDIILKHEKDTK